MEASHRHVIGQHVGEPGPTLVVMAGIHGNEPAGLQAIERVLAWLQAQRPAFCGRFIGLAGNLAALREHVRFVDEDLNRIWTPERIAAIREPGWRPASAEQRQQAGILAELDRIFDAIDGPVTFLDLHTSSARGKPFVCIGDTLRNRHFADVFPVPVILGLEEQIDGALLEYVNNRGHVTLGIEAGQHDHPESVDRHEAFVLLALVGGGLVAGNAMPQAAQMSRRLSASVAGLPRVLEVRYRHAIRPADGFAMREGFSNFQEVPRDEPLAQDGHGTIRARETGRLLLPLYQGLGSDGFFLVREVRRFWLVVSAWLRRLRADRLAPLLPGVQAHVGADALVVDPRIARWFAVEFFHLLGYRKERPEGSRLRFTRRRESY